MLENYNSLDMVECLCLKNSIMPFIVLNKEKIFYIKGLEEYDRDQTYLKETWLHFQDIYENVCQQLLDFNIED